MTSIQGDATTAITRLLGEFLRSLTADQIEGLLNRGSTIAILPAGARIEKAFDAEDVRKSLAAFTTRLEGERYIKSLKLLKPDLLKLAQALDVSPGLKDSVTTLIDKIVGGTVGGRADTAAIRF